MPFESKSPKIKIGRHLQRQQSLSDEELVEILGELYAGRSSSNRGRGLFVTFIREYASRDSAAAFAIYQIEEMTVHEAGWSFVAEKLAADHPDLPKKWLTEELPKGGPNLRSTFMSFGIGAMVKSMTLQEVLGFYQKAQIPKNYSEKQRSTHMRTIFYTFAKSAPEEAESAAFNSLKGNDLYVALGCIASVTMKSNPEKAMALAQKIENDSARQETLTNLRRQLVGLDMEAALSQFEKLDGGQLQQIFDEAWTSRHPSAAGLIAKAHPEKLVEFMKLITVSSANTQIFQQAIRGLVAAEQGEMALELIGSFPQSGLRDKLYGDYYGDTVAADPKVALQGFTTLPEGKRRDLAYEELGKYTGKHSGFEETLQILNESVPESDKGEFLKGALLRNIPDDAAKVAEFLATEEAQYFTPAVRQWAHSHVGRWFADQDSDKALVWFKELPAADQTGAIDGLSQKLVKENVQDLVSLLSEMPKNDAWSTGVKTLIGDLKNSDPATAASWQKLLEENSK